MVVRGMFDICHQYSDLNNRWNKIIRKIYRSRHSYRITEQADLEVFQQICWFHPTCAVSCQRAAAAGRRLVW